MAAESGAGAKVGKPQRPAGSRIWLSLFEDAGRAEWPPTTESHGWRVLLTRSETLLGCNYSGLYRTSPVFPATDAFVEPDLSTGVHFVCFYCFDPAFQVLGRLASKASEGLKAGLMYTLGLASILVITKDVALLKELEAIANAPLKSKEIWEVENSKIRSIKPSVAERVPREFGAPNIRPYAALPLAVRTTVDEFVACMAVILPKVQIHVPDEINTFLTLIGLVNDLVSEMLYAYNPSGPPPDTLSEYTEQEFLDDSSISTQIIHQNMDRLVQIDSALSYVATQALTGAVPILERRSLIRRYSLLGVGTAVLALTRIAHSIESAFAGSAIETILEDFGGSLTPLPGIDRLPMYDPTSWKEYSRRALDKDVEARGLCPKLPYFSGRLGFRETEYTISAAIQSLGAGASAEWSFLTVTHEMVHGHVRHLLSVIFQGDLKRSTDDEWQRFYDRFSARCHQQDIPDEGLLDSLRAIILMYCCNTIDAGSLTEIPPRPHIWVENRMRFFSKRPKPDELRRVLSTEFRNVSEIIVHVLDMHYFYVSCLQHYIPLIWKSWSKAPQVRADLRQYLLRSLLVIAARKQGGPDERFRSSRALLEELLGRVDEENGKKMPVIAEAIRMLRGGLPEDRLFPAFYASLIIVDLATHVFTSSKVLRAIRAADPHFRAAHDDTINEEWLQYDMPEGFVDEEVMSPTAYIAHRLTNQIDDESERDIEAETAAMFLACSSRQVGGGIS
jgi:hypothetical protein